MFKFFRRIRFKMLPENKFSKYLLYAIGEIILVVIGILIALQINNWNEQRKIQNTEISTLKELKSALEISKQNLISLVNNNKRWQSYNFKIKDYLENKKAYDKSLDICFGTYYWTGKAQLTTAAYDQLKNDGLDLITNNSLRKELIYVFEDFFGQIKNEHEQWEKDYLANIIYPNHVKFFQKYFPYSTNEFYDEYAKPINYNALLDDAEFLNIISENISLRNYSMLFKEQLIVKIDSLNNRIDKEIKRLDD
ncbi:DUF6090 family protein [Formosa maritima]|uniref:Uncharacterized protein n=1 Tax=Formosa maritima TaxID=2592046 RepID=A0A5D0G291_9FLAO|nr:DUF6090 family protein [Formosa maritima]TYA53223.1 hypothetical protein FVF61_11280 [Formosa maritima]